ncbi:HTH-type transcriptional activator RhaR [Vibrio stylophorae]|uniref:HTH-type transcriptional activator RhaR n=1 Tax=Vibrio stylophorae TaxID=659351 RepID=A0ABN8DS39_9VIBR|nr:AraC family transcriptional regulator [Vibrio stylophorae]CAH0533926.1 HTH-type transcriptional activator RhaR [Vibrio stylophorae]
MRRVFLPCFGGVFEDANLAPAQAILMQLLSKHFSTHTCGDALDRFQHCAVQYVALVDLSASHRWLDRAIRYALQHHKIVLVLTAEPLHFIHLPASITLVDSTMSEADLDWIMARWKDALFCLSHRSDCCQQQCLVASNDAMFSANERQLQSIEPALSYIDSHLDQPIREEQLASLCHYSLTYFSRLFHRAMGVNCRDYIVDMRLRLACRILKEEPLLRVGQVANACGFRDPSYFSRIFKKRMAMTPQQYRQQNL